MVAAVADGDLFLCWRFSFGFAWVLDCAALQDLIEDLVVLTLPGLSGVALSSLDTIEAS